jgi:hypothetical protein
VALAVQRLQALTNIRQTVAARTAFRQPASIVGDNDFQAIVELVIRNSTSVADEWRITLFKASLIGKSRLCRTDPVA